MSTTEPIYQAGICPRCPSGILQQFLFATENCYGPITEQGKIVAYEQFEILSLFRCVKCEANLLFLTEYDSPVPISLDELGLSDPNEVAELDPMTFLEISTLVWPTSVTHSLDLHVPKTVRDIYEEALLVKNLSPNSFAVQVGRALEAVQKDLGIPKRGLEQLESHSPHGLSQLAIRIKDWRNIAAHSDSVNITGQQVEDIDAFFLLITDYVYVLPHKLEKARSKIEIAVDDSVDGAVH